jgi:hypothetical protein
VQFVESGDLNSPIEIVRKRIADKIGRYPAAAVVAAHFHQRMVGEPGLRRRLWRFHQGGSRRSLTFDLGDFDRVAVGVVGNAVWLQSNTSAEVGGRSSDVTVASERDY